MFSHKSSLIFSLLYFYASGIMLRAAPFVSCRRRRLFLVNSGSLGVRVRFIRPSIPGTRVQTIKYLNINTALARARSRNPHVARTRAHFIHMHEPQAPRIQTLLQTHSNREEEVVRQYGAFIGFLVVFFSLVFRSCVIRI